MQRIKVLIVDDHPVVRMGLKSALETEDDMEILAEAESAEAALREARAGSPDVVLMDVRMPGMDGIQGCRLIREQVPKAKVVMLTSFSDEEAVMASIMAGAVGYLLKNTARADLLKAIRTVAAGESLLDPAVTSRVLARLKDLAAKAVAHEVSVLSEREREVLGLVAAGFTNKEIAGRLIISDNTARNHVSRIMEKLGVTRRSEAATFAARHGLLDDRRTPQ